MIGRRSTERGAAGTITALLLTASIALSAVVVDVGSAWQERRHLVVSTDAAALAAAHDFAEGVDGCASTAPAYVASNNGEATMTSCDHTPPAGDDAGWVTVEADATVTFNFARVVGITDTTVTSSTSVSYDSATAVSGGLRPFGLCVDFLSELTPAMTPGNGEIYRIYYGRTAQVTNCNGGDPIAGNWGILDFDGGSNSQNDIKDWTENGYEGPPDVSIGDWIQGTPGSYSTSLSSELAHLRDNVDEFVLPIFSEYNDLGGGNAEFLIDNFVVVKLHDFQTTGDQDDRYVDLEFLRGVVEGSGGGGDPTDLGAYVIGICAVDGVDAAAACA